jgi:hypothetical protein
MTSIAFSDLFHFGQTGVSIGRKSVPVWGGSRFVCDAIPKTKPYDIVVGWFRRFRRVAAILFDARDRGSHGGRITRFHEDVLEALIFRCRNPRTGVIDPAVSTIARMARASCSAVYAALAELRELGVIDWENRCDRDKATGQLFQVTNLYELRPPDQWLHQPPPEAPAPEIGAPEHVPDAWEAADQAAASGDHGAVVAALECEPPGNRVVDALSRLGKAVDGNPVPDCAMPEQDVMPEPELLSPGGWTQAEHTAAVEAQEARRKAFNEASERRVLAKWAARHDAGKASKP